MSQVGPGVAEVVMQYLQGGERLQNVYHVYNGTGAAWAEAELINIGNVFTSWEDTTASGFRCNTVEYTGAIVTDLTSLDAARITFPVDPPIAGAVISPPEPNNVTVAVKASTGKRGRGRQGRTFWIGISEDFISGNTVTAARASDIVGALNDLRAALEAYNPAYDLVVLHRYEDNTYLSVMTHDPILNYRITDLTVDSQVNRLPGHKRHKRRQPLT